MKGSRSGDVVFEIADTPGRLGPGVPLNVDILVIEADDWIGDLDRLISLHEILRRTLDALCSTRLARGEQPSAWL